MAKKKRMASGGYEIGRLVDQSGGMVDSVVHPTLLQDHEAALLKNVSLDEKGTVKPCLGRIERFEEPFDPDNPCNGITAFYPDTTTSRLIIGAGSKLFKDAPHLITRWTEQAHFEEAGSVRINCDTATKPGELTVTTPPTATFTRASVACLPDGTNATVDNPRYVDGKYTKAIMVEEGTTNLLSNPSFEIDSNSDGLADDWNTFTGGDGIDPTRVVTITRVQALHHGSYAQRTEIDNVSYSDKDQGLSKWVGISPNTDYTLSAYVKTNAMNKVYVAIRWYDSNNKALGDKQSSIIQTPNAITRLSVSDTSPSNATKCTVYIRGINANGEWLEVDAVQLEAKPYPTSFVPKAVNLLTAESASFEGGTIGDWNSNKATISIVNNGWHGSKGLKVVSSETKGRAQINITSKVAVGDTISLTAWARLESGSPRTVSMAITVDGVSTQAVSKTIYSDRWTKISVTSTLTTLGNGVYIQLFGGQFQVDYGTVIWDGIQVEKSSYATTFTDGTRSPETLTIPGEVMPDNEGTITLWARKNDVRAVRARKILDAESPRIDWQWSENGNYSVNFGGASFGIPDPAQDTDWHFYAVTYSGRTVKLYFDGLLVASGQATQDLKSFTTLYLGTRYAPLGKNWNTADATFDDLRISNRALTDEEIAAAYASGQPLPVDEYTTAKMNFDSNLAISIPFIWISDKKDITAAQDTASGKVETKIDTPGGSSIAVLTRTSDNGTTWDDWQIVASDNTIQSAYKNYIQVKVIGKMWGADKPSVQEIILSYDGSPSAMELASGLTPGGQWFFDTLLSKCIMTNKLDAPMVWDGYNPIAVLGGSPPHAQYVAAHKNYLFMAGTSEGPSRLYFSEVLNLESWPVLNFIDISPNDGDWITGLLPYDDYLIITKNRSVWLLIGSGPSDFEMRRIHDGIGCVAPRSLVRVVDSFAFVSTEGIYLSDISTPTLISERLKETWKKLNRRRLHQIAAEYYDHKLRVDVPYGSSIHNNMRIIYDTIRKCLYLQELSAHASCYTKYSEAGQEVLLFGHAHNGQVSQADTGTSDAGLPIKMEWGTKHFNFGSSAVIKKVRNLYFVVVPPSAPVTVQVYLIVDGEELPTPLEFEVVPGKMVYKLKPRNIGVRSIRSLGYRIVQAEASGGVRFHELLQEYLPKKVKPS